MTGVDAGVLEKPRLRGVFHQGALVLAVVAGPFLVAAAHGATARVAAGVFAGSVVACFGASALYHRGNWTPRARVWLRRLDHVGIYLLIAGTYTPVSLFVLRGAWRPTILAIVWSGALLAIVLKLVWISSPRWVAAALGIALGWVAAAALPQLVSRLRPAGTVLLVVGGLAYTAGAVVYARRKPDPFPAVFGFHELFHVLTVIAAACQYVAIAFFVLAGR